MRITLKRLYDYNHLGNILYLSTRNKIDLYRMKYLNIKKALAAWQELQPLSEKDRERLSRRFTVDFNYNSNHIEGNTLMYGQTEILLLFGKVIVIYAELHLLVVEVAARPQVLGLVLRFEIKHRLFDILII